MIKTRLGQSRICQGDIFRDIEFIEYASERMGIINISTIIFPLVIVLTQDCDLEQDYKFRYSRSKQDTQDKWLISVLVAPLYNAEHVFNGEHLSELSMDMQKILKKEEKEKIKTNQVARYHYLEFSEEIHITNSIIDFKHYFSVNSIYLRKVKSNNFIRSVKPLYRESISQRFSFFLSRIGLPESAESS
jgi:hypothetical protein